MSSNSTILGLGARTRRVGTARQRANRLSPEERRRQLLDCAVRVFGRRGLGRGGHAEVASEAGVAVPTVFAYFRTREELCGAVLDAVAGFYEDMADHYHRSDRPAARILLDNMLAFAASVDSHPDHARILLDWSTAIREDVWPLYLAFYDRMVKRLEATIRRGQEEGTIPADLEVEETAFGLVGSAFMVGQMKFTHRPPEQVHRFLLTMLRAAVGRDAVAAGLS